MAYIPFEELTINEQKRNKKIGKKNFINTGLDTETYKGKVRLICDDSGRYLFPNNFNEVLNFLTHARFRNNFNWFFNIRFDFESIIKIIDDLEILTNLYENKWIEYNNYKISYLEGKYINIVDNNGHSYHFYDIANFIQTSLNEASKNFLGKEKFDNIDASRLNIDIQYWKDNISDIKKYCIQDCILTKEIADYFINMMKETVNFIPQKMFSKGSYSQEYFLKTCYMPTINKIPLKVLEYAYKSYSGGRFELMKRGHFDKFYTYDIKSAYPYQMTNLIDINKGLWKQTDSFRDNAFYGYYLCDITFFDNIISPFMQKIHGLNVYPNGNFQQYLTQNEYLYIHKNFKHVDIDVISGIVFYPNELIYPLRQKIHELYLWKETEKDPDIKYMVKIIQNSLYGKFIQKIGGKTGQLFNPVWASEITANARLQIIDFVLNNSACSRDKALNKLIGFSTDSVHIGRQMTETNINPDLMSLGDLKEDFTGEGIFIMSDVYSAWNKTKTKDKFRGFSIKINGEKNSIKTICGNCLCCPKYDYYQIRPFHLGESLKRKEKDISKINIWCKLPKTINLNGDYKRIWDNNFDNGWQCFKDQHSSIPVLVE